MTKEEREFIREHAMFGHCKIDDDDQEIPYVAIPNMRRPDGSVRAFSADEVIEVLQEGKENGNK